MEIHGGQFQDRVGYIHARPRQRLSAAQQLPVEGTDLRQDLADAMVVGQVFLDLVVVILGYVFHPRACAGLTDR